ncbi:MAG: Bug family tripartite tricarboxylate transporter substrate binding protein [Lautropia sp.]
MRRTVLHVLTALVMVGPVCAQTFPERPVRLVVPYGAGGNFDIIARLLAQHLSERWGKSVVVENKPGANGNIGTAEISRSAPDGYNLAMVSNGTLAINPGLYRTMPFDSVGGLTPITVVTTNPLVLVVNKSVPARSVQEFIDYARKNPGKVNLANGGNGTLSHLSAEMLNSRTRSSIALVPYKGTSFAVNGLLAGDVQGMFDTISTALPLIDAGRVNALAVTSPTRFPQRPELPTIAEAGVEDYSAEAKAGLVGPPGMPRRLVEQIQRDVSAVLKKPEVRQKLVSMGVEPLGSTAEQFAADILAELKRWNDIVRNSGAKLE